MTSLLRLVNTRKLLRNRAQAVNVFSVKLAVNRSSLLCVVKGDNDIKIK